MKLFMSALLAILFTAHSATSQELDGTLKKIKDSGTFYQKWFGAFGSPSPAIQAMYLLNGLPE